MTDPDPLDEYPRPPRLHVRFLPDGEAAGYLPRGECRPDCEPDEGRHVEPLYGDRHLDPDTLILLGVADRHWVVIESRHDIEPGGPFPESIPNASPDDPDDTLPGMVYVFRFTSPPAEGEPRDKFQSVETLQAPPGQPDDDPVDGEPGGPLADDMLAIAMRGRDVRVQEAAQWFACGHLPRDLQAASAIYSSVAVTLLQESDDSDDLIDALRTLLRAKDAGVRVCASRLGLAQIVDPVFHVPSVLAEDAELTTTVVDGPTLLTAAHEPRERP